MVVVPTWNEDRGFYYGEKPLFTLSGDQEDWGEVKSVLKELSKIKKEQLGLVGYVGFEGNFWFGFYPCLSLFKDRFKLSAFLKSKKKSKASAFIRPAFVSNIGPQGYASMVTKAKEYIAAGDIYVINLARQISCQWEADPLSVLAFFLHEGKGLGGICYLDDAPQTLVCASPELFLQINGKRMTSKPIKGTRPRNGDRVSNRKNLLDLVQSEKEKAELLMITDLVRNDFGKVCHYGTVKVSQLWRITAHPHLYHMHCTIEGILSSAYDMIDAFLSNFPGGSVTGTPKKRAIEIIKELEPNPRGLYSGAIGYFMPQEAAFTMAIRLVVIEKGVATFHVGSGITYDSDPYAEYEETEQKAIFIKSALENCLK
ncbi:anthranilate synthase component I family protein [Candidatus Methylacidiphilum fumarolicum]|uniref:Anthranilate/para-aminobenzoate synthase component I n=2 Tax=Candidatus Methylacidiphilum fumarolicum TaxID=591154 RepID=I0K0Z3_METFB|nr:anthranilate synthase component I family protein [Candidatus Methylacidiphilum fumarolicum]MBW6413968.1 anthranilate synthase component I family protein [Candidatus Methylacidiphilum fumarolicum]TFE70510.1 metal ABC transporter ATP-binding protein [Candidatus Methylacidiphilum fumarolicum]TFE74772.1 anthranilate synthase component I family protein [Candidatus Methylacidiphilum fumarolicum]TFE76018.1 anthranilate synthase component I family protein [Candidatus Methylacidiphilum fumarolicum]T